MTPLDAARRLAEADFTVRGYDKHEESGDARDWSVCVACGSEWPPHTPDCPVLALPRIVAALEVAKRVAIEKQHPTHPDNLWLALDALVAALKGEGVTA